MFKIRAIDDLTEAERLWERNWPQRCLFDLWILRSCFQIHFDRPPLFLAAESHGRLQGMLALSWIEEAQCYGHFPGETWQGKTWLEQNRIHAGNSDVAGALLRRIPAPADIRYLTGESLSLVNWNALEDEIGYLFFPKQHGYSFESYLHSFSGKSRKKIRRELERLETPGLRFRYDCFQDLKYLFQMNLERFEEGSYFSDLRFLRSFEDLTAWLQANGLLRVTTVLIGGKIAAVDMGAVWRSTYTVLAGGTHADFPGVAKLINFQHIEWACRKKFAWVDFLCGDFGWKSRFHLIPRPLFRVSIAGARETRSDVVSSVSLACVQ